MLNMFRNCIRKRLCPGPPRGSFTKLPILPSQLRMGKPLPPLSIRAENAENDGPSKLQDMRLMDQCAGREIAGLENDGPICRT